MSRAAFPLAPGLAGATRRAAARGGFSTQSYALGVDLLLLLDPILFFAAWLATRLVGWGALAASVDGLGLAREAASAAWTTAMLSPFLLFDRRFGRLVSHAAAAPLLLAHGQRLLLLGLVLAALAAAGAPWHRLPVPWLLAWFAAGAAATLLVRLLLAQLAQGLVRRGLLTETVAVVGAGPLAQRFVAELVATRPQPLVLLGIFDDLPASTRRGAPARDGSIDELLALGMARRIDWIVLALPAAEGARVQALVQRLKSLSVPIALCPPQPGHLRSVHAIDYVGQTIPVALLAPDVGARSLPRWLGTMVELGALAVAALRGVVRDRVTARLNGGSEVRSEVRSQVRSEVRSEGRPLPTSALHVRFDALALDGFVPVAAGFGMQRLGVVVTPNADHLIRLHDDPAFRAHYAQADHVLLDSRFVAHLLRATRGLRVPVCTGSDLTAALFARVIGADDRVVLIGASPAQAQWLRERHGLRRLLHVDPPMGFIHDPRAVAECLAFVEAHSPFRFCLLAVGSPQQEQLATLLRSRGRARGLVLCIGASINFLTGAERRAPRWMQQGGLEWLFRLLQAPRRLGRRYLLRGPRLFGVLRDAEIELRRVGAPSVG